MKATRDGGDTTYSFVWSLADAATIKQYGEAIGTIICTKRNWHAITVAGWYLGAFLDLDDGLVALSNAQRLSVAA